MNDTDKHAMNVAIAEAMGKWRDVHISPSHGIPRGYRLVDEGDELEGWECTPDFTDSLDACAEFEKTLKRLQHEGTEYCVELRRIVVRDCEGKGLEHPDTDRLDDLWFYGATPLQRCEAFCRVRKIGPFAEGKG